MLSPAPHVLDADDTVSTLIRRLGALCQAMPSPEPRGLSLDNARHHDARLDQVLDDIEVVTLAVASTRASTIEECRQKASVLRERLIDLLDVAVPSEAVTLALVASLTLDLIRLSA